MHEFCWQEDIYQSAQSSGNFIADAETWIATDSGHSGDIIDNLRYRLSNWTESVLCANNASVFEIDLDIPLARGQA